MILCIDIGNTNITIGVYKGNKLESHWRLATDLERMPDEYGIQLLGLFAFSNLFTEEIEGGIMASVVPPLTEKWIQICNTYIGFKPLVISPQIMTGVLIHYDEPNAVGADRIVDAVATHHLHGGPACIVDFGTATTFDAITEKGEYLGGAIAPGIQIAAEALSYRTAKLPRIDIARPPSVIGRNTTHSMQSGILYGYISMVEGMVERFRSELCPNMKVIATGGLAEVIAQETDVFDVIAPWLTLDGLNIIYKMNTPHSV